jgi:hypothetical protein
MEFFWQNLVRKKEGAKVQGDFLGKNGPNLQNYERNKSKVAIFREYVSTIHQFIRGILSFFTSPFDVKPNSAILFCMTTIKTKKINNQH